MNSYPNNMSPLVVPSIRQSIQIEVPLRKIDAKILVIVVLIFLVLGLLVLAMSRRWKKTNIVSKPPSIAHLNPTAKTILEEPQKPQINKQKSALTSTSVPAHLTDLEKEVATDILEDWITGSPPGNAFSCPPMTTASLSQESQKKVFDYFLDKGIIAAWTVGWGGYHLMKVDLSDQVPFLKEEGFQLIVDPALWRTQATLEKEKSFIQKNQILLSPYTNEILQRFPITEERRRLRQLVNFLNTRVNESPFEISFEEGDETIFAYLLEKKLIGSFKLEERGKMKSLQIYPV